MAVQRAEDHRRVVLRVGGFAGAFYGLVYHSTDSAGQPALVIAVPVGRDHEALQAISRELGASDGDEVLDYLVDRIGRLGADVLPYTDAVTPHRTDA